MALLASRERMQQRFQEQSDVAAKERKEREDAKVQQKIEAWDNLSGWGPGQSLDSNKVLCNDTACACCTLTSKVGLLVKRLIGIYLSGIYFYAFNLKEVCFIQSLSLLI